MILMRLQNGNHVPRQASSGSTTPSERGPRGVNGVHSRPPKSAPVPPKQRVPNADEFPVLGGSSTPPQANGHTSHNGPTAAQVLQAPAVRKEIQKSDAAVEGQEQFRPTASQVRFHFRVWNVCCAVHRRMDCRPLRPMLQH